MALQFLPTGWLYPVRGILSLGQSAPALAFSTLANAADRIHQIGRVRFFGGSVPKSVTRIRFVTGAWTPGASNVLTVGLQNVDTVYNPLRGTGTYTNSGTLSGGSINASTGNFVTLGTNATLNGGDLVCVSMHWSTYVSGSLEVARLVAPAPNQMPAFTANNVAMAGVPDVLFECTDGTFGIMENADFTIGVTDGPSWNNASSNSERGNVFRVPLACQVTGLWVGGFRLSATTGTLVARLYENVLTTPTVLQTVTVTSAQWAQATGAQRFVSFPFASTALTAGVDYGLTLEATSAVSVSAPALSIQDPAHSGPLAGGTTAYRIERTRITDTTPAFTQVNTQAFQMGVRISALEDGGVTSGSSMARSLLNVGIN